MVVPNTTVSHDNSGVNSQLDIKTEDTPYGQHTNDETIERGVPSNTTISQDNSGVNSQSMQDGRKYSMPAVDEKAIRDIQAIGRKSVNDFTADDIAKTEGFAKTYWKEMGTKSPFFRSWFGDWRAHDRRPVEVATHKGDSRGVVRNADTGWDIQVSGKVFNETKVHTKHENVLARQYLPFINDIVDKAVLLNSYGMENDKTKSHNSLLMHDFYAVADIGNGAELLKLYVEEMYDPNKKGTAKRAYQLQNIESRRLSAKGSGKALAQSSSTADIHTVSDLFAAVKQKDKRSCSAAKKVVTDANGARRLGRNLPISFSDHYQYIRFFL